MKYAIEGIAMIVLCLSGIRTHGAEDPPPAFVTNNVTIVISAETDNLLRNAWKLDNHARTNGFFPYQGVLPALTLKDFRESIGKQAFEAAASRARQNNEEYIRNFFPRADDDTQMRIIRILTGKE